MNVNGKSITVDTSSGIPLAGFRLDGEFLRAVQQIASSFTIPVLGGGGVSLTNNNRTGTLTINCAKVSTPAPELEDSSYKDDDGVEHVTTAVTAGSMFVGDNLGPVYNVSSTTADGVETIKYTNQVYDLTFIAQAQQAQEGGDSVGSTICVVFKFCGLTTKIQFEGCTITSVDPIALTGNDAASYQVVINYLNWRADYSRTEQGGNFIA